VKNQICQTEPQTRLDYNHNGRDIESGGFYLAIPPWSYHQFEVKGSLRVLLGPATNPAKQPVTIAIKMVQLRHLDALRQ
jgi:hypothetical protein